MVAQRRILVVDDDPKICIVFSGALRRLGKQYQVHTATDGREALRLFEQSLFDLLITDINMNNIDGVELTRRVLSASPTTAVIWITAYGCRKLSDRDNYQDIYTCLDKPIDIQEIRESALQALQQRDREQFDRTRAKASTRLRKSRDAHNGLTFNADPIST